MIGYLKGKVRFFEPDGTAVVDVSDIGYAVLVTQKFREKIRIGEVHEFSIHTHVREDALELFGFENSWEKRVFLLLTSVSGIGPRTAMTVLSHTDAERFLEAVVREDKPSLTSISGIGKKTADRLIVELSDKASKLLSELFDDQNKSNQTAKGKSSGIPAQGAVSAGGVLAEAVSALVALGYREADAWMIVREIASQSPDSEGGEKQPLELQSVIRKSLQRIAKK